MMAIVKVRKVGNSHTITVPIRYMRSVGLSDGTYVEITLYRDGFFARKLSENAVIEMINSASVSISTGKLERGDT